MAAQARVILIQEVCDLMRDVWDPSEFGDPMDNQVRHAQMVLDNCIYNPRNNRREYGPRNTGTDVEEVLNQVTQTLLMAFSSRVPAYTNIEHACRLMLEPAREENTRNHQVERVDLSPLETEQETMLTLLKVIATGLGTLDNSFRVLLAGVVRNIRSDLVTLRGVQIPRPPMTRLIFESWEQILGMTNHLSHLRDPVNDECYDSFTRILTDPIFNNFMEGRFSQCNIDTRLE
jgi:hypothetical protein